MGRGDTPFVMCESDERRSVRVQQHIHLLSREELRTASGDPVVGGPRLAEKNGETREGVARRPCGPPAARPRARSSRAPNGT